MIIEILFYLVLLIVYVYGGLVLITSVANKSTNFWAYMDLSTDIKFMFRIFLWPVTFICYFFYKWRLK